MWRPRRIDRAGNLVQSSAVRVLLPLIAAAFLSAATPAAAVHWPQQGGDAGRSGYQAVGDGAAPVRPLWSVGANAAVGPLVTAGALGDQRVVYGTTDGRVHLRDLSTGRPRGPEGGVAVDETLGANVFGDPATGGGAAFAESSGPGGLGMVFVVHNADNRQPFFGGLDDVEVAVVDEGSGGVLQDVPVRGTVDHRVNGPAVLSPPDAQGGRSLLFLSEAPGGGVQLLRIPVDGTGRLGQADAAAVPGADPRAGAAIAYLPVAGGVRPFAVVGAGNGVVSFALDRFPESGPSASLPPGGYGTPAVAVATAGLLPGQAGSAAASAPGITVLGGEPGAVRVHRLELRDGALTPVVSSDPMPGARAPGLALAQEVVGGQVAPGWVLAGTTEGLDVLDARSLRRVGRVPGAAFARSLGSAAGAVGYAAADDGTPVAIDLPSGMALATPSFPVDPGHGAATRPAGQPAISRGFVIFATDAGLFAYRTRCGNAIAGSPGNDRLQAGLPGDAIAGGEGNDALGGGDGDDCLDGGPGRDRVRGDAGEDTLGGAEGADLAAGGPGGDKLRGGPGADRLDGGAGDDILLGDEGADILLGGEGRDRLAGGRGDDRLDGGAQGDAINARGGGHDRIRCGPGRDTVLADRSDRVLRDCERVLRR